MEKDSKSTVQLHRMNLELNNTELRMDVQHMLDKRRELIE